MSTSQRSRPDLTLGPVVCAWIETFCVHGPGDVLGEPVRLTKDERRFLYLAYELERDGSRKVRRAVRGLPKISRKTEMAAWVALVEMAGPARCERVVDGGPVPAQVVDPFVVCAAASYDQADLLFGAATACVREGPLSEFLQCFDQEIQFRDELGKAGRIRRVPAAAGSNDGLRPTFYVADETHEWTGNKQRVHLVLENGLSKRKDAWSMSITTAGNPRVESVAKSQYEYGVKVAAGEIDDDRFLFDWREPDPFDIEDLADDGFRRSLVEVCNPEPWKRVDDIAQRFHEIPTHEFARYFLNVWCEPDQDRWLAPGVWGPLADGERTVEDGARVVLGFDGSYSGDSTALIGATVEECPHLFVVGKWEKGVDFDEHVPVDAVDAAVRDAMERFDVAELSADPPYWAQQIQRWEDDYGEVVVRFETYVRKRMAAACSEFYAAANQGTLSHDGDASLARHLDNAVPSETQYGVHITKESKSSPHKIDLAVAAVVAFVRARWHHDHADDGVKPLVAWA